MPNPAERLSVLEAIRVYTYNGADAHFEERSKGSIEEGKLADLAVLPGDVLDLPTEEIKDLHVDMTVVGGRVVYEFADEASRGLRVAPYATGTAR